MVHPWSDLTPEELMDFIDFCRDWFTFIDPETEQPEGLDWRWKKGDWYWYQGKIDCTAGSIHKTTDRQLVPLPLAHQWPDIIKKHIEESEDGYAGIYTDYDTDELEVRIEYFYDKTHMTEMDSHKNHSFAYCLAFKRYVDDKI
jgi:hypothetical protein